VRAAVALALATQSEPAALLLGEFTKLLEDESSAVINAALLGLMRHGRAAEQCAFKSMLRAFRKGILDCDNVLLAHAVAALQAVCPDGAEQACAHFEEDHEVRESAREAWRAAIDESLFLSPRLPTCNSLPIPFPEFGRRSASTDRAAVSRI
jgi:hypothetical protein